MKCLIFDHNKGIWRKIWRNVILVNLYPSLLLVCRWHVYCTPLRRYLYLYLLIVKIEFHLRIQNCNSFPQGCAVGMLYIINLCVRLLQPFPHFLPLCSPLKYFISIHIWQTKKYIWLSFSFGIFAIVYSFDKFHFQPSLTNDEMYPIIIFSCPEQLNRWPCHSVTHSITDSVTLNDRA